METTVCRRFCVVALHAPRSGGLSYGILAKSFEDGRMREAVLLPDLSRDREPVALLAACCEICQPSPMLLQELVLEALL